MIKQMTVNAANILMKESKGNAPLGRNSSFNLFPPLRSLREWIRTFILLHIMLIKSKKVIFLLFLHSFALKGGILLT